MANVQLKVNPKALLPRKFNKLRGSPSLSPPISHNFLYLTSLTHDDEIFLNMKIIIKAMT